ncbi:putative TIR domain, winged helix-turn-helix DNA-binding domain-containing protein [Rosa chinensis]|uniref:Putative TIR domain, winged helix-turn-helix DNA-binding domain-containing protein n=1 Tax=Rosa chinensis TaxID=74649 RepID=A0A2P6PPG8_ROSCH|nr:disease resistance protein RUN1 [Rosa chinensis]PRQ23820.1 putative TIR domain, winged helix-turn-helix DNA-binding domain-containing protein [Rosa chinensis]
MKRASSSPIFNPNSWTYDVFLSFRGEDTRCGFTGHLLNSLVHKGINTFIDDDGLTRGEEISSSLLKVIEESRISIIIFSENYASSKWCLDELVQIFHCHESKQQMVRPVFYKVDPSDIRHHKGSFGEALAKHERRLRENVEKVKLWRTTLTKAANLSGDHFKEGEYEYKFINNLVDEISVQLLNQTYLNVAKYPVGIESRVQDIYQLLSIGTTGRCVAGIWGAAGIGKTTIAKAVYNSIGHRFQGRCFLENVGEKSLSNEGLLHLQETLLSETLGGTNLKVGTVHKGMNVIKQRLSHKKVLLILDDVNELDWLSNLAGATGLFGDGSRVIITTKDKGLLTRNGIKLIYEVKTLDCYQALELFSWYAFDTNEPPVEYVALARRAIDYVQRLPLALKVFGTYLGTLETIDRWQTILDSYKSAPYKEIQKPFRICYDALEEEEKQVFLDIACFFNGKEKDILKELLKDDELDFPEDYIEVLIQKAFISLDYDNRIWMHNLLEQMGKHIARQEPLTEPGERSRLWFHKDVYRVLTENTGTSKIKGILVKFPKPVDILLSAKSFSGMSNLKYFINCNASLSGYCGYLPYSLKLIDWGWCQLKSFPSNFHPKELIVLHMPHSHITQLGKGLMKCLTKVTSLNFEGCKFLKSISDFSGLSNMKSLNLRYCTSLLEIDPSVGFLENLVTLDLEGCTNLEMFPNRVGWKSLESISLKYCKKLKKFPEIVEKMESLRSIYMEASGIEELPSSIGFLSGLHILFANRCEALKNLPCSIYEFQHLSFLGLNHCPKLVTLPNKSNSEVSVSNVGSLPLALQTNSNTSHSPALPKLGAYASQDATYPALISLIILSASPH